MTCTPQSILVVKKYTSREKFPWLTPHAADPIFCVFRTVLGPGSASIGFGMRFYAKLTYRELRSSRERLIQTNVNVKISDATSRTSLRGNIDFLREDLLPWTPPERCAAKLCFFWRAEQFPILFLSPNGEKNVVQNLS